MKYKLDMYKSTVDDLQKRGNVAGSLGQIRDQLKVLEQAGVQRIMLQWLDLDDLESLQVLAAGDPVDCPVGKRNFSVPYWPSGQELLHCCAV